MKKKNILRRIANRILGVVARWTPGSTTVRPFLHRLRGVRIKGRVFIGDDVYMENEYPECIEMEDGVQICLRSVLVAHNHGVGTILLRKNSFIGANCVIIAAPRRALTIGEGAVITAGSVIASDVPAGTLFGMDKAKPLARATVPFTMEATFQEFLGGLRPLLPPK
jgi:acetyltransferase-like isoleucine patch superfamily enzyme